MDKKNNMFSDLGVGFLIRALHFGDGYNLNYYRAFFLTENDAEPLCDCFGGHQTIRQAMNCKKVIKRSAIFAANRL